MLILPYFLKANYGLKYTCALIFISGFWYKTTQPDHFLNGHKSIFYFLMENPVMYMSLS